MNMDLLDYLSAYWNAAKVGMGLSKYITNWYAIPLYRLGILKKLKIKSKLWGNYVIKNNLDYQNFWDNFGFNIIGVKPAKKSDKIIEYPWKDKLLRLYITNGTWGAVKDQFIDEQYKWLKVKDKIVVDIGANMGDTAIYFALNGAKKVFAFEPYPRIYNLAKSNIRINKKGKQIKIFNQGVGNPGTIYIKEDYRSGGGAQLKNFNKGKAIQIHSLSEIVQKWHIPEHSVLKVDCEGSEYEILLNSNFQTLQKFDMVMVEYHYGYKNLIKKLKGIYSEVRYTKPTFVRNIEAENKNMYIGLIYASKLKS